MTTHIEAKRYSSDAEHIDVTLKSHPKGLRFVLENNGEVVVYDGHSWAWSNTATATPAGKIWTEVVEVPYRKGDHAGETQLSVHHDHVGQGAAFEQRPETLIENQGGYEWVKVLQTEPVQP